MYRKFKRGVGDFWQRSRFAWIMLLASLLLSGCVQYDVGVNFASPHRGEIVQHIKLGERLTSFSGESATQWLSSIERRARELQGKVKRISAEEITVKIPFNNGAELEQKFNQFFNPVSQQNATVAAAEELPKIDSKLDLQQNNLLLLLRNRLSYDLDLRSLSLIANNNNVLVSPGSLFDLEFRLNTPWGSRSVEKAENSIAPENPQNRRQMVWKLQPGQINHLEAVFWLPNPLGIGAVVIGLIVASGIFLRYNFMPDPRTISKPSVVPQNQAS
ncbi:DUF3153 domain-containing protein [Aliterella atlantica]|uniref:DUF3153 domain-containing protein n=1 Tax=Aliterella atlantica TaxID=1827278 RepID=UPI0005D44722|nr:DUF3153 domain-containing protein [Aliterella atlantica]